MLEGLSEKAAVKKKILPLCVSGCQVPLDIQSTAAQGAGEEEQREPGQAEGRGGEGGEGGGRQEEGSSPGLPKKRLL